MKRPTHEKSHDCTRQSGSTVRLCAPAFRHASVCSHPHGTVSTHRELLTSLRTIEAASLRLILTPCRTLVAQTDKLRFGGGVPSQSPGGNFAAKDERDLGHALAATGFQIIT